MEVIIDIFLKIMYYIYEIINVHMYLGYQSKEKKMVNKRNWLGILVLVFGMTVVGNIEAQTDSRLNGTWVQTTNGIEIEIRFRNGNFEELYNGVSFRRGTYTTNTRELTIIPTNINGAGFNTLMSATGIDFGLESKWYSFNEFIITARVALLRLGASEREADEFVKSAVSANTTSTYSVDDNILILTTPFQGENIVIILTKK